MAVLKSKSVKIRFGIALAFSLFLTQLTIATEAQTGDWQIYSPPDKSFTVEIPAKMQIVECDKDSCEYSAIKSLGDEYRFSVFVIPSNIFKNEAFRSFPKKDVALYLAVLSIGHDNDPSEMDEKSVKVNNLNGMEYLSRLRKRRGRFFEIGNKLYLIRFKANSEDELLSPDANRFLDSFRVNNKVRTE